MFWEIASDMVDLNLNKTALKISSVGVTIPTIMQT